MITKFKIFESKDKGQHILYTFKTKAISNSGHEYNVNILESEYVISDDEYYNLVLSVEGTPGSWYISTLIENDSFNSDYAVIDGGSNWIVNNWNEVGKELFEMLPNLEAMIQAKKYNI